MNKFDDLVMGMEDCINFLLGKETYLRDLLLRCEVEDMNFQNIVGTLDLLIKGIECLSSFTSNSEKLKVLFRGQE